jgi:hypothetical protein
MICPYCLQVVTQNGTLCANTACQKAGQALPALYRQLHKGGGPAPLTVSIVGFPGHGKTYFIASLFHIMEDALPTAWNGKGFWGHQKQFTRLALNQETIEILNNLITLYRRGELLPKTPVIFPEPSIHRLDDIPDIGERTMILYDPPGEAFNTIDSVKGLASYASQSNTMMLLMSLVDLTPNNEALEMGKLLEIYLNGLGELGRTYRNKQHLLIVYTKADLVKDRFRLPPEVLSYLEHSDIPCSRAVRGYRRQMKSISDALRNFTVNELRATGFLGNATRRFKSVEFSICSALGTPEPGIVPESRRVLDPMLWVLDRS